MEEQKYTNSETTPATQPQPMVSPSTYIGAAGGLTPSQEPRQGNRKLSIILLVVLLIALGVAGTLLYLHFNKSGTTKTAITPSSMTSASSTTKKTTTIPTDTTSSDIIAAVQQQLAAKYKLVDTVGTPTAASTLNYQAGTFSPLWQAQGANYYTAVPAGHSFESIYYQGASNDSNEFHTIQSVYQSVLSSKSFKAVTGSPSTDQQTYYLGPSAVCAIDGESTQSNPASITCAQLSDYTAQSAKIKQIADVYPNSAGMGFGVPIIKDAKTSGYQTAQINMSSPGGVGGSEGLFYSKNGAWHYFRNTQQELGCAEYNTQDLRLAYAGEQCYTGTNGTQSTVQ